MLFRIGGVIEPKNAGKLELAHFMIARDAYFENAIRQ